jgi:8-oxo-dGTP diphosphatase
MPINSTPEVHHLVICSNLFVIKGDKILMLRRSEGKKYLPGYLQPVGGKVDVGEDPLTAASRELMEEAGIKAKNIVLKGVVTEIKHSQDAIYDTNWQIFQFVGEYEDGELGETEEGELLWVTLAELKEMKIADSIRFIIDQLVSSSSGIVFAKYTYDQGGKIVEKELHAA